MMMRGLVSQWRLLLLLFVDTCHGFGGLHTTSVLSRTRVEVVTGTQTTQQHHQHQHQQHSPVFVVVGHNHGRSCFCSGARSSSSLFGVIRADDKDFDYDRGLGGVRLAEESALELVGKVIIKNKKKKNSSDDGDDDYGIKKVKPIKKSSVIAGLDDDDDEGHFDYLNDVDDRIDVQIENLIRYTEMTQLSTQDVMDTLSRVDGNIICTGIGNENYKDPGETTNKIVIYAPPDAIRDALSSLQSTTTTTASGGGGSGSNSIIGDGKRLVINFLGGEDLQVLEVVHAIKKCVEGIFLEDNNDNNDDIEGIPEIFFHSVSHKSFPLEKVTATLVSVPAAAGTKEEDDDNNTLLVGLKKEIYTGHIHFRDGKYYTVSEGNINTATA